MGLGATAPVTAQELIRRPEISYRSFLEWEGRPLPDLPPGTLNELESRIKYAGYITKQEQAVERTARLHDKRYLLTLTIIRRTIFRGKRARSWPNCARHDWTGLADGRGYPGRYLCTVLYLERPGAMSKKKPQQKGSQIMIVKVKNPGSSPAGITG